jgi:hypothetical protein
MSLLSDQRQLCRELALEARRDDTEIAAARLQLRLQLRRQISSPAALVGFFAAGFATGLFLSAAGGRDHGARGERSAALSRGRRAMATGLWLLRMIEALGG